MAFHRGSIGMVTLARQLLLCMACVPNAGHTRETAHVPSEQPHPLGETGLSSPSRSGFPDAAEDGVTFFQATSARPLDLSRSGGEVHFIWGGASTSHALGSKYYPMDRDMNRSHDIAWYRANFADAVAYRCDGTTPATTFAYNWGSYTPIDVTNSRVRNYVFKTFLKPALAQGERVIALDNVSLRNPGGRCGVYRDGKWVRLFTGEARDPAFENSVFDWIGWLRKQIHEEGGQLALNAKVDSTELESTRRLISLADVWLLEAGFTRDCAERVSDDQWRARLELSQWAAARMPWIDLDKSCASPQALDDSEAQWIVSNFLLAKGSQSFLGVVHDGEPNKMLRYPAALNPPVGRPVGEAVATQGGGMARQFTKGLVVVNPSSKGPLLFQVPQGKWSDIRGRTVSGTVLLAKTSAMVLLSVQ
jgi:hypothetical protein